MRRRGVTLLAAGLLAAPLWAAPLWAAPILALADPPAPPQPAAAPPQPAAAPPQPAAIAAANPDAPAADAVYYPAAARAAGVEGQAVIHCDRNERLALRNCKLVSETPAGQGFGAAALAMAAKSPENPKLNLADPSVRPPLDVVARFRLHPPAIVPDLTQMGHTLLAPSLVTVPTPAQIQAAYPARALADGVDGAAVLDCLVTAKGALDDCRLYGEEPTGYGFGAAALDLAGDFVLRPRLLDGDPFGGAEVRVPVQFRAHDPAAPLELKTTP